MWIHLFLQSDSRSDSWEVVRVRRRRKKKRRKAWEVVCDDGGGGGMVGWLMGRK